MNDADYNRLREKSWRQQLTVEEEAELRSWLVAHPELASDWEAEARINHALDRLPDASVSTNFTARVLEAVDLEAKAAARPRGLRRIWSWRLWLPQTATACVLLGLGVLTYGHYQLARQAAADRRSALARNVAAVSKVAAVSDPKTLQDFEAIRRLNQTTPDNELIALFK